MLLAVEASVLASDHRNWPFDLIVGAAVCAVAVLRARNRLWAVVIGLAVTAVAIAVAAVAGLPGQPGNAALLALLLLGAAAIRTAPLRPAVAVAVAGMAVVVAGRVIPSSPAYRESAALFGVLVWAAGLAVGLWLRCLDTQRQRVLDAVRRDERLSMARELHDVVAHHVTGMVVQAQAARLVSTKRPETVEPALAGIETAGTEALAAMHRLVGLLRDPGDAAGTSPSPGQLSELVARFTARGPAITLQLPADGSEQRWPPEVAATVYRIVQEALTNIIRHAPNVHRVTVTVAGDPRTVTVDVTDDAVPATGRARHSGGYGLVGMSERVEALGGTLHAGPRAGVGWSVQATVPLTAGAGS